MTATIRGFLNTHNPIIVVATAVVSVGVSAAFMLPQSETRPAPQRLHAAAADAVLCHEFYNATPGSAAAFRLADAIASQGVC